MVKAHLLLKNTSASASFSGENWLQAELSGKYDAVKGINYASDDIAKRVVSVEFDHQRRRSIG